MIKLIKNNKEIIWHLAINDFSTKYAGSLFGTFWAYFQPVITIIIYAVVFQFGLKSTSPVDNISYIFWFSAGMIPWFFFSDGIRAVTNSLLEYSYLVKKVVFDVRMLPIIKILSTIFVHLVFIIILCVISIINQKSISLYAIQILYYLFCAVILIYAIGKLTSSLILFFRDLGQIVNIILDIAMWATPIIWSYSIIPVSFQFIVKLNPVFYLIEGYRDSFFNKVWFFEKLDITIYYWVITLCILFVANKVFDRMRPQFADVL